MIRLFLFSILFLFQAQPTTFYVATCGNDRNTGVSIECQAGGSNGPLLTVQKAVDLVRNPGDTVSILPGRYTNGAVIVKKHGLPGQPITIQSYDSTNKAVLSGDRAVINITASSYIDINNLEITNYTTSGIAVLISRHITIRNNYIHLGFEGYCGDGEGLPLCKMAGQPKGRLTHTGEYILEPDGRQNGGIFLCKSSDGRITNNHIANVDEGVYVGNAGDVVEFDCWTAGVEPETWTKRILVDGNLIDNSFEEGIEFKPDVKESVIRNNVIKSSGRNSGTAIEVRGNNNDIVSNIIVDAVANGIRTDTGACHNAGVGQRQEYPDLCAYENLIKNNQVWYFSAVIEKQAGIHSREDAAADRVTNNTIVGNLGYKPLRVEAIDGISKNNTIIPTVDEPICGLEFLRAVDISQLRTIIGFCNEQIVR